MNRNTLLAGGLLVVFMILATMLIAMPAWAERIIVDQTTLEDFNAGTFYHTGLTRFEDGEVQLLVVGLAGDWITDTNTTGLPALSRHTAVYANNHIIVLGGRGSDDMPRNQVYYTTINPDSHDLANWQATTALPSSTYPHGGVFWHASVVVHDRVYVLGGQDTSSKFATVSFAPIHADGSVGSWQTTASLPVALSCLKAVVVNDRIYVIGGWDASGITRAEVYFASPDPGTGQITSWTPTASFAYQTHAQMVAVDQGRIYVMGGSHISELVSPYVYYTTPDPATGAITGWTRTTDMRHNLFGGEGLSFRGVLYTTGGAINNLTSPSQYVGATLIGTGGGVGSWNNTSLVEPGRFYHAAVRSDDGWLYVINGSNGTDPIRSINRGATSGVGSQYADDGTFDSSTMDLGGVNKLRKLHWNSTIADTTLMNITMEYRTKNSASDEWSDWFGPYQSSLTPGTVTTTVTLSRYARYVEYRATLATADNTMTPSLNAVRLEYETPTYALQVIKDADPVPGSTLRPGDQIAYTLTYSNGVGGITATKTFILDAPPQYTSYVAGTIFGPGADDSNPKLLRWNIGQVGPEQSGEVGYSVLISPTLMENVTIENVASIDSDQGPARDSNVVTHTVQAAYDLDVVKSAEPSSGSEVQPGSVIAYTLIYANVGYRDLSGVTLSDVLPDYVTYVPGSIWPPTQGNDSNPSELTWSIGDLAPGVEASASFQVVVDSNVPAGITITNEFTGNSDQTDPEVSAPVEHVVHVPTRSITVTKSANPPDGSLVQPGQNIVYTLHYLNDGEAALSGLVLTDVLPDYVTYVPNSISPAAQGNASNPNILTWSVPDLAPGASGTASFAVTVDDVPGNLTIENLFTADSMQIEAVQSNSVTHTTQREGPDLRITSIKSVPFDPPPGTPFTLIVAVENTGGDDAKADVGGFWVEVYIKPLPSTTPQGPSDHYMGVCTNQPCAEPYRWEYVEGLTELGQGKLGSLEFSGLKLPTGGDYDVYAQVDVDFGEVDPRWGHYVEEDELNNLYHMVLGKAGIYLPLIYRNR